MGILGAEIPKTTLFKTLYTHIKLDENFENMIIK